MVNREQKLFLEASDWEARFYQIQSKYLLLLNELHNPQVMISTSRQEMVGNLLKDIVENSDKPTLSFEKPEYDRFGFRLEKNGTLTEKAERLQRVAQANLEEAELSKEKIERSWQDVVVALGRPGHFTVSKEMKNLIHRGVPINLRGTVWRALILNRTRGNVGDQGYYQALLSNYNPGLTLSSAAKQIELDLLRTLPNNIYYDSPHAKGNAAPLTIFPSFLSAIQVSPSLGEFSWPTVSTILMLSIARDLTGLQPLLSFSLMRRMHSGVCCT